MVESENFTICDNISDGQIVGNVRASAPAGQLLTYRLTDNAGGLFEIDENNGNVSLASGKSLDYSMATQHTITALVSNTVAIKDTSTVSFQVNVNTAPFFPLYIGQQTFSRGSNMSIVLSNNRGGMVESVTNSSGSFPMGLSNVIVDGQVLIQGRPDSVTLSRFVERIFGTNISTNTNVMVTNDDGTVMTIPMVVTTNIRLNNGSAVGPVRIELKAENQCGMSLSAVDITVNPSIYTQGDISSTFSVTNIPFVDSGTGTLEDPFIIAMTEEADDISFNLDLVNAGIPVNDSQEGNFYILWLNLPQNNFTFRTILIVKAVPSSVIMETFGGSIGESSPLRYASFTAVNTPLQVPMVTRSNSFLMTVRLRSSIDGENPVSTITAGQLILSRFSLLIFF